MTTWFKRWLILLFGLSVLTGCDGDGSVFVSLPEGQIVVEPNTSVLAVGSTQQYSATLVSTISGDPAKEDVTATAEWVSTNPKVASVDADGLVTALSSGETDIVATKDYYRGRAKLQVSDKSISEITIEPVESKLLVGLDKQFIAIARFSDNTTQDITIDANWASSDVSVATINDTGTATGVAIGTTTISASFAGSTGNSNLEVINTLVDSFVVTPFENSLHAGGQVQLLSHLILIDGTSIDVTNAVNWASSGEGTATVGNATAYDRTELRPKGLVTGVAQGSAVITATADLPGGARNATANVTVTAPLVTSLQVIPSQVSVPRGTTGTLRAIAHYTDNSVEDVTREAGWLSDDHNVVFVVTTGDRAGDAAAIGVGQTIVTASFGGQTAISDITVTDAVIKSIHITPEDLTLSLGSSGHYVATAIYTDLTTDDVTQEATWVASDPAVIDLVPSGVNAGFVQTLSVGTSTVTASFNGIDGSTGIEVTAATLDALQIEPANISVPAGADGQYTATAYYSDGTFEIVTEQSTWQSTDQSVMDVVTSGQNGGKYSANAVGGPVTISAIYKGLTAITPATVTAAVIESITITPVNLSLPVGSSGRYQAQAFYSDKTSADITEVADWLSSDSAVAQIIATGVDAGSVTTLSQGDTTISASLDGVTGNTALTVTAAVITSLQVTPSDITVPAGAVGPYTATAFYSDNSTEDVTKQATWESSNTSVATVIPTGDDGGITTTKIAGSTNISASYSGITTSTPLTVTAAVLVSIDVSPVNYIVPLGVDVQYTAIGIYSDNTSSDLTDSATWQSSDTTIATISASGFATTVAQGNTTITAKIATGGGAFITGSTGLTVNAEAVTEIVVLPFAVDAHPGQSGHFTAIAYYTDNSSRDVTRDSSWSSSDTTVIHVVPGGDQAGFAVASGLGEADVTAYFQTFADSAHVSVTPAVLESIQITPVNDSVSKGLRIQYTATGLYSDGGSADITDNVAWQSSVTSVATIQSGGLATGVNTGATVITATLGTVTASTNLTVAAPILTNLVVTPASNVLPLLTTQQLTATAYYSDGSTQIVNGESTWTSSDASKATVKASGENAGLVTAVGVGAAVITANYQTLSATADVEVTSPTLIDIFVKPLAETLSIGLDEQYTAIGIYNNGTSSDLTNSVTWRSSDIGIAVIDLQGKASAVAIGAVTISAQSGSVTGNAQLTVTAASIVSLQVTPPHVLLPDGTTAQLTAVATYTDNSTSDVTSSTTWSSSDTAIASVTNGDDGGLVKAHSIGSATITGSISGVSATSAIDVSTPVLDTIQVTPQDKNLASGVNQQYSATGNYSDGSTADLTTQVSWQSSNTNAATIDGNGLATSAIGLASTEVTTITATLGMVSGSAQLTVTTATITELVVIPFEAEVHPGQSGQFTAISYYTDGSSRDVTTQALWTSSDLMTVAIFPSGENAGFAIALSANVTPAIITASFDGETATSEILVTPATIESIQIEPVTRSVPAGNNVQYKATGTYSDNTSSDITDLVTWNSSDTSIATIDLSGLAETIIAGSTTISASLDSKSASTSLTVTDAVVTGLQILPAQASVHAGGSIQLTATAFYSNGDSQDVTRQASWSSDNTAAATVQSNNDKAGLVETHGAGSATISALFGGTTRSTVSVLAVASSEITVTAPILDSIQVLPVDVSIPNGTVKQYTAFAIYTDGTSQDISNVVFWQSSDNAVASVNLTGLVKGLLVDPAPVTISADFGGMSGSTTVTVINAVIDQLVITPQGGSVPLGVSGQLTATAIYTDGSDDDVTKLATWASSNPAVASVNTTGENGGLVQTLSVGITTISANFDGKTASAGLNVTSAVLSSILVDPANKSVAKGFDIQYTATGVYTDSTSSDITTSVSWQSSVPTVATIDANGKAQSILEGNTQIRATLGTITGTAELDVTAATIISLHITPEQISVPAGVEGQLQAFAIYSDNDTQDVTSQCTWLSDMPSIVTVVASGDSAGYAQALASGGPVIVTARLQDGDGTVYSSTSLITVTNAVLTEIQINPPNETIASGIDLQYQAIGIYTDSETADITDEVVWLSDDPILVSIDQNGYATTSDLLTGTANISASYGIITATTPLNVIAIAGERLEISPKNSSIAEDTSEQFEATAILNNGTSFPVTDLVTWESSDASVATISNDIATKGQATAIGVGNSEIKASIVYQGDLFEDTANIEVTPRVLDHIIISSEETTIFVNTTTQFHAQGVYVGGDTDDLTDVVTWTTSDSGIAIVSNIDGNNGSTLGVSEGTATIAATFIDASARSLTDSQDIDVVSRNIASLKITPGNSVIPLGEEIQYAATATMVDGDTVDVTSQVLWDSANDAVAVVSSDGLASAVSASSTTISASLDGFTDNVLLAVTDAANVIISITPLGERIAEGTELQFEAQITIGGLPIEGATEAVIWSSTDDDIASISNKNKKEGLAKGEAPGTVDITAAYVYAADDTEYTATTTLQVLDLEAFPFTVNVTPKNVSIDKKDHQQYTLTGTWDIGGGDFIVQDLTKDKEASWDTGDDDIASIKNDGGKKGEAKGEDPGTTTVTGEFGGVSDTTNITVNP